MHARIFRPAKTAVSSGRRKTHAWRLELEPQDRKEPDRLMGWIGSGDTGQQLALSFPTAEAAIAYCRRHGLAYTLDAPQDRVVRPKSYAENFLRRP
jgi:hypothetical protein